MESCRSQRFKIPVSLLQDLWNAGSRRAAHSQRHVSTPHLTHRPTFSGPARARCPKLATPNFAASYTARSRAELNRHWSQNPGNMSTSVKIANAPTVDVPGTAIYVHHDKRSYLFGNVCEGTQRACGSRGTSIHRVEHAFLSGSMGWEQMGGLFGFLLSIAGAAKAVIESMESKGKGKVRSANGFWVHGGDNLSHVLAVGRAALFRKQMRIRAEEHRRDPRIEDPTNISPDWQDDALKVWKIPVRRSRSSISRKRRHVSETANGADTQNDEAITGDKKTTPDLDLMTYIIERVMFSTDEHEKIFMVPTKLGEVKSNDFAVVKQDGQLRLYKGPYAPDGATLPNPDDEAWTLREYEEIPKGIEAESLLNHKLPPTSYSELSMSYIVKPHDRRGTINAPLAKSLGIEKQQFRPLSNGESVTLPDGSVVTPEMVTGDPIQGKGFVVADIESRDFVDSFIDRPEWSNTELMNNIHIMYWVLGPGMASESRIQDFVKAHPTIRHVFCGPETCPNMISNPRATSVHMKLHTIDPARFSVPYYDNTVEYSSPPEGFEFGRTGMELQIMPRFKDFDDKIMPFPDLLEASQGLNDEALALGQAAKEKTADAAFAARVEAEERDIPSRDAEVIALGTGSSCPSTHRNVSGTLVRVPGIGSFLLDCGEGTLGQIRRILGPAEAENVLRELRCIALSHLHSDHHLGATSVVKAWYEQTLKDGSNARLAVSCIGRIRDMLVEMSQVEDIGIHRLYFPNCPDPKQLDGKLFVGGSGLKDFGLDSIRHIPVDHCWLAHAIQLEFTSGLRVAYSGDCRPSKRFARECQGAHLLIHECTFADDAAEHAVAKKHSTISEAIGVARDMKARRLLLTHFSQRYVKSKSVTTEDLANDQNGENLGRGLAMLMAFDFMRVKLGEFQQAACYQPAIMKLMESQAD